MKEKLEQEIGQLKQRIAKKEKVSRKLDLIVPLSAATVLLGVVVLCCLPEKVVESFGKSPGFIIVIIWVLVLVVLAVILAYGFEVPINTLKGKLRRAEKKPKAVEK